MLSAVKDPLVANIPMGRKLSSDPMLKDAEASAVWTSLALTSRLTRVKPTLRLLILTLLLKTFLKRGSLTLSPSPHLSFLFPFPSSLLPFLHRSGSPSPSLPLPLPPLPLSLSPSLSHPRFLFGTLAGLIVDEVRLEYWSIGVTTTSRSKERPFSATCDAACLFRGNDLGC